MACEEKKQEMMQVEADLKIFNIKYAYGMGLIREKDLARLIIPWEDYNKKGGAQCLDLECLNS